MESVAWEHRDVSQASVRGATAAELEPWGSNAGISKPLTLASRSPEAFEAARTYPFFGNMISGQCIVDGIEMPCGMVSSSATQPKPVGATTAQRSLRPKQLPGLNPFAAPSVKKLYGDRPWATSGNGVIEFSAQANPFAAPSVIYRTPLQKTLVPREEVEAYRERIEETLKDERCSNFLSQLLDEVKTLTGKSYNDIVTTFDNVKFYYMRTGVHGGYATFEHGERVAYIDNTIKTERFTSADRSAVLISLTTGHFLAETLHHIASGRYSMYDDSEYARAVNAIFMRQGVDQHKDFPNKTPADINAASIYWHSRVHRHCSYPRK
jgi:hypothetical protein